MALQEIRNEIKTLLESVDGIGKVHDFERWTVDWKKFLEFFKTADNKINGWVITRSESRESEHAAGAVNIRSHTFLIKGYYGLKDSLESEKIFQDLIENICSALRRNNDLNGSCLNSDPPQVSLLKPGTFGGILTHQCQIRLIAREYVQYTPA